jgi:hypothetical protein
MARQAIVAEMTDPEASQTRSLERARLPLLRTGTGKDHASTTAAESFATTASSMAKRTKEKAREAIMEKEDRAGRAITARRKRTENSLT